MIRKWRRQKIPATASKYQTCSISFIFQIFNSGILCLLRFASAFYFWSHVPNTKYLNNPNRFSSKGRELSPQPSSQFYLLVETVFKIRVTEQLMLRSSASSTEAYPGVPKTCKMENFPTKVNGSKPAFLT